MPRLSRLLPFALAALSAGLTMPRPQAAEPGSPDSIRWRKTVLDTRFRSEGATIGDVNGDKYPDVLTGDLWFENPLSTGKEWKRHEIRPPQEYNGATGYSNCFLNFAADVDRDGEVDQIVVGFPGAKSVWYRNPGKGVGSWTEHPVTESACNESPIFADIVGDRTPELITPFKESQMAYYSPGDRPRDGMAQQLVGAPGQPGVQRFSHGLGAGDVDGDGRADILCADGYYRQPRGRETLWQFVPAAFGPACAQMHVYDFDGDGDRDLISSSAHQIGIWWYEQRKSPTGRVEFTQHVIDDSFSQSHSLVMADLNRDGRPDFITGKRFWAHGPNGDVNPADPAVLRWYEFRRESSGVRWLRHAIDEDSGVGTHFTVADVNRDRRLDIAVSNKKGVFVFEQVP